MNTQPTVKAARGAVSISADDPKLLSGALGELMDSLAQKNHFQVKDIISLHFTQTPDLVSQNVAAALRESRPAYNAVPLLCSQEPRYPGSLPLTIRILVTWYGEGEAVPVYLGAAASLRPDLAEKD